MSRIGFTILAILSMASTGIGVYQVQLINGMRQELSMSEADDPVGTWELEQLRLENHALRLSMMQAVSAHLAAAAPAAEQPAGVTQPLIPEELPWGQLPPLPPARPRQQPAPALTVPSASETEEPVAAPERQGAPVPAAAPSADSRGELLFKPLRISEDGSLVYLSHGNIRVAPPGGRLYGVNGRFISGDRLEVQLELARRPVVMKLDSAPVEKTIDN